MRRDIYTTQLVVKFGTGVLLGRCGEKEDCFDQEIFDRAAGQIVEAQNNGVAVILVSSGAVKAGRERVRDLGVFYHGMDKKALAGIGARHLLNKWGVAFEKYKREVAQIWVTSANWSKESEREIIRFNILDYYKHQVIPIMNENDVVSNDKNISIETGIKENDRLARMIAELMRADSVLFLTEAGGVYEENPLLNSRARRYKEIDLATAEKISSLAFGMSSCGTGGIGIKLKEAQLCAKSGKRVAIAGIELDVIRKFAMGESVGTMIGNSVRF